MLSTTDQSLKCAGVDVVGTGKKPQAQAGSSGSKLKHVFTRSQSAS